MNHWAVVGALYALAGLITSLIVSRVIRRAPKTYGAPMTAGEAVTCTLLWPLAAFLGLMEVCATWRIALHERKKGQNDARKSH